MQLQLLATYPRASWIFNSWESGLLISYLTHCSRPDQKGWFDLPGPAEIWQEEEDSDWIDTVCSVDDIALAYSLVFAHTADRPPQAGRLLLPESEGGRTNIGNRLGCSQQGQIGNLLWGGNGNN
jgi:hypothetical protein